ncbi:MAG TPA: beta-ketoacyl-ACP reductase, partial [Nitrospinae bacterium]|nr:beta-ketoacyl-ACP reductase [Nitrospinota bacterium]
TGGGRGIGRACCLALAEAGAAVAINYSASEEAAEEVRAAIEEGGGRAATYRADVSSFELVGSMFEALKEDFAA